MPARLIELCERVETVFLGNPRVVRLAVATLVARGHLLIEDVPGLGKTLLARALSQALDADFKRIQFTPDLLPADVTGVSVWDLAERRFQFVPGPIFARVLLADEINRTSPRTQSALLEAMEERQVTTEGTSRPLSPTFFVVATQNPVELAGTYPLPEAQLDRFLMRIDLGYPSAADEARILELHGGLDGAPLQPLLDLDALLDLQARATRVLVGSEMRDYIVAIATATRGRDDVSLGVSPRGSLALMRAARAWALLSGRDFVAPDDVKAVAPYVLAHRLVLAPQGELSGREARRIVDEVLDAVPVPAGTGSTVS